MGRSLKLRLVMLCGDVPTWEERTQRKLENENKMDKYWRFCCCCCNTGKQLLIVGYNYYYYYLLKAYRVNHTGHLGAFHKFKSRTS